ncbi:MAG: hypothetical protein JO257_09350 [Deltaproteobacteria bacterium]|nr:hypothetical protein [Deltaproteobacteria bacterium]
MKRLLVVVVVALGSNAHAWSIGSQLDNTGCHEKITTAAFRAARAKFATAPAIVPTRDEAALISEVQFVPPADFRGDLAAMSLLLGVRDNDLKGNNPLDSLQLTEVHGNPTTQEEHCIRAAEDDGVAGDTAALDRCRAFIRTRIADALGGLAADGTVDPSARMELRVYVSFAGHVKPMLPTFYVRLGQAVHALEDGFTHTYRTPDGSAVTVVMNWIDYVSTRGAKPEIDGPPHLAVMDHCEGSDPLVKRNADLATQAATELFEIALDPSLTTDAKLAAVDALTAKYLAYQPGCTLDNAYCDAREPHVTGPGATGCDAGAGDAGWILAVLVLLARLARAQPAPEPVGGSGSAAGSGSVAPDAPAVPAPPQDPAAAAAVEQGHEPKRDIKTPTVAEVAKVREVKALGPPLGVAVMLGGSFVHGALDVAIGVRYRINERWVVGGDVEWNPWITSVPWSVKAGAASAYGTVIRRYPMKLDRVNLRTTVSLGVSTLLFDIYGAPKYDIGPFVGVSPLGIDYDLGNATRLVIDPLSIDLPVPHLGLIPLYYEQFRTMIGLQFRS